MSALIVAGVALAVLLALIAGLHHVIRKHLDARPIRLKEKP